MPQVSLLALVLLLGWPSRAMLPDEYWNLRSEMLAQEQAMAIGGNLVLTDSENRANVILMAAKTEEFDKCMDPLCFPPAKYFADVKADIEASEVFKIIKQMPKGAVLHGHDTAMVSTDWIVQNVTYRENLYVCAKVSFEQPSPPLTLDLIGFIFASDYPASATCADGAWFLVSDLRAKYPPEEVDTWFAYNLSLLPHKYTDVNIVWAAFNELFAKITGLLTYTPVFRDYYVQTLQEFMDDNVQYLELRSLLGPTYDLDGSMTDYMSLAHMYAEDSANFMADHMDDWLGARLIYAPLRSVDNDTMDQYIEQIKALLKALPDFIAGFDLVGQEDKGKPYIDFINQLLQLRIDVPEIKYFLHAGETNWQGITDLNIIDAVLLGTTRIGHGYAITKHPQAVKMAMQNGIAIEVNPLSNQVLRLVEDMRNHPVASLLAVNFPVVVSCDDPSFWGAKGVTYDYYQMFMGMAPRDADLRFLKQLAMNSITYSSMNAKEKTCAMQAWQIKWDTFIQTINGDTPPVEKRFPFQCQQLWQRKSQYRRANGT